MHFRQILLLCFLMASCSSDDTEELAGFSITDLPQTWELFQINTGLSGEVVGAEELGISERYVFRTDGTFSKQFQSTSATGAITGSFELVNNPDGSFLELTYSAAPMALSLCSDNSQEFFRILEDNRNLFNGSCLAFDGPGLAYTRTD